MPNAKPLTDRAWQLIVAAAPSGVRGKVFRMSRLMMWDICRERNMPLTTLPTLYSVPVVIDYSARGITLEDRR